MSAYWPDQRWDVGAWDQALWDGQLGISVAPGAVQVTGPAATLELAATLHYAFNVLPGAITVDGEAATLMLTRVPLLPVERPPGVLVFGYPTILSRW
jgi:hypothetical protein